MAIFDIKFGEKIFKRKHTRKARKMTNEQLRQALWDVREENENKNDPVDSDIQLMLLEDIYSSELKNRELLEWALKSSS